MTIYAKTTRDLMHEFASERLKPGQTFSRQEAAKWFAAKYPAIKSNTVMMHVEGMSTNSPQRKHHPHIREGLGWDLFYKLGPSAFRLWNAATDPAPVYKHTLEVDVGADAATGPEDAAEYDDATTASQSFAFERDLQNYLARNLGSIERGLRIYEDEDRQFNGLEFPAGQRYIDILALSAKDEFVVIETKVSRAYDRVVGQVLRYMAWVKANLAGPAKVRGIIVASEITSDLRLAASLVPEISLVEYSISFSLRPVSASSG